MVTIDWWWRRSLRNVSRWVLFKSGIRMTARSGYRSGVSRIPLRKRNIAARTKLLDWMVPLEQTIVTSRWQWLWDKVSTLVTVKNFENIILCNRIIGNFHKKSLKVYFTWRKLYYRFTKVIIGAYSSAIVCCWTILLSSIGKTIMWRRPILII